MTKGEPMFAKCPRLYGGVTLLSGAPSISSYQNLVLDEWSLYDPSRRLVPDSGFYRGVPTYGSLGGASVTRYVAGRVLKHMPEDDYFWLGPIHSHFGHFVVSTLARAWAFPSHVTGSTKLAYVGDTSPQGLFSIPFMRECLTALGIKEEQMVPVSGPIRFPRITVAGMSFIENHSVHRAHIDMFNRIATTLRGPAGGTSLAAPIYVSKQKVAAGVRNIINESELTDALGRLGVEVACPETLSFQEQLAFWESHRSFVGFASSAFHMASFFTDKRLCTISHDEYASSNQALLDIASGNENLHVCAVDALVSRGPSDRFSDTLEIKDPVEMARQIAQLMDAYVSRRSVRAQILAPEPRSLCQTAMVDEPFGTNLAPAGTASQSSDYSIDEGQNRTAEGAISGRLTGCYQCSTECQQNPWWQVELNDPSIINEVRVFNRCDNPVAQARLNSLQILLSMDGLAWVTVAERTDTTFVGGFHGEPFRWLAPPGIAARFVRLQLPGLTYLHVDQVEVFGEATSHG